MFNGDSGSTVSYGCTYASIAPVCRQLWLNGAS